CGCPAPDVGKVHAVGDQPPLCHVEIPKAVHRGKMMRGCPLNHLPSLPIQKRAGDHEQRTGAPVRCGLKGTFDLARALHLQRQDFSLQKSSRVLYFLPAALTVATPQGGHTYGTRSDLCEKL